MMKCSNCDYEGETLNESKGLGFSIMGYEVDGVRLYDIDGCPFCGVLQVIQSSNQTTRDE